MHITAANDMSPHFWVDITTCCSGAGCASVLRNDKQQTKTRPTIFVFVRLAQPSSARTEGNNFTGSSWCGATAAQQQHNSSATARHADTGLTSGIT